MRKLASVQKIAEVRPIDGADAIVAVRINDWWCVAKKDEFEEGDWCVYFEIDSLLPITDTFSFLAPRGTKFVTLDDGTTIEGYRLKTIRLRGQLSQGLALPTTILFQNDICWDDPEGVDVSELLGVHKYEPPEESQGNCRRARGNFPAFLKKTDQERCQNLRRSIWDAYVADVKFQVSAKLDGSSMTVYNVEKEGSVSSGVCSRNIDLIDEPGNQFWDVIRDKIGEMAEKYPNYAIQGELVSPRIQKNFEGVTRDLFFVFSMFDIKNQKYVAPEECFVASQDLGLNHVPVLHHSVTLRELFPNATQETIVKMLLDYAEGPSSLNGKTREGLVYKSEDGQFSFKTISNLYLLKHER